MLVDYFLLRRGNLSLTDLFTLSSEGRYYFCHGFNLRAFAAFVIGFLLPLPGFAASFGREINIAATHMYSLGWVLSFLMGCLSYYIICLVFKLPGDDGTHAFESQVQSAQQIIVDGFDIDTESHGSAASVGSGHIKEREVVEKMA